MDYEISGCPVKIYNSENDIYDNIIIKINNLPDTASIYIWPDLIGRHILKRLNEVTKSINVYITGGIVNFMFSSYLKQLITNDKIKIIDATPETVDLTIINTRPYQINSGLISFHENIVPMQVDEVLEEIGANLGAKHTGVDTPYQLKAILIDEVVKKSKEFLFIFVGDLYKDVCSVILERKDTNSCISGTLFNHILQKGKPVSSMIDVLASQQLEIIRMPWLQNNFTWDERCAKIALVQASLNLQKAITNLTTDDLVHSVRAQMDERQLDEYKLKTNEILKNKIQYVSKGLPFLYHAKRDKPLRVILFSPHPDDDVISAGGGCLTMAQGQDIEFHVAYCVTGACAVSDECVKNIIQQYSVKVDENEQSQKVELNSILVTYLNNGKTDYDNQINTNSNESLKKQYITHNTLTQEIAQLLFGSGITPKSKAFLREIEAQSGLDQLGFFKKQCNQAHFLRLPFYGSGYGVRTIYDEKDVNRIIQLIKEIQPDIMFLAGDLSDPHGTHGHCYNAIKEAFNKVEYESIQQMSIDEYMQCQSLYSLTNGNCNFSLDQAVQVCAAKNLTYKVMYRGAWAEFEPYNAQFFIQLNKEQMKIKRQAIIQHKSQMGAALYLGHNSQPFDERAIERNTSNAGNIKTLGVIDTEDIQDCIGIECYVGCGILP